MPDRFELSAPDDHAISIAARALEGGGLVVLPTDTVYGVGARPDLPAATGRLFEAKRRPRDLTLPVLGASRPQLDDVARFTEVGERLARRFWPGPLTLVLPRTEGSRAWSLGDEDETVGVRVPADEIALALLARAGPLAVTSANRSGEPTPRDCDGVVDALGDAVDVYLCAGPSPIGVASTVVDLTAGEPRVLREGAVPAEEVLSASRGT